MIASTSTGFGNNIYTSFGPTYRSYGQIMNNYFQVTNGKRWVQNYYLSIDPTYWADASADLAIPNRTFVTPTEYAKVIIKDYKGNVVMETTSDYWVKHQDEISKKHRLENTHPIRLPNTPKFSIVIFSDLVNDPIPETGL